MAINSTVRIRIIATSDEHGTRMYDNGFSASSSEMLSWLRQHEGYNSGEFLLLSSGDFNYGDGLSILSKGESSLRAMTQMGYSACVLGNADIGSFSKQLTMWSSLAGFPLLAANLTKYDGSTLDSIAPYAIIEHCGIRVGIIGLTVADQPFVTSLDGEKFAVQGYEETLRKVAPEVRARGAQIIIVLAHEGHDALVRLAEQVEDLKIPLFLGGHWHRLRKSVVCSGKIWVIESGCHWHSYSRIDMEYDPTTGSALVVEAKQTMIAPPLPQPDETLESVIAEYKNKYPRDYECLGSTVRDLDLNDVYSFFCNCFLAQDSKSDIALMTAGHLRQGIPSGNITRMLLLDVTNHNNAIYRLSLTGHQLQHYLSGGGRFTGVAGLTRSDGDYALESSATYYVLVTEYMYEVESPILKSFDPKPEIAFSDWRQPAVDWLISHKTILAES